MDDYGEEFKLVQNKKKQKYSDLDDLTRDEQIDEVIKARVEAERAKKGTKSKEVVRKRNSSVYSKRIRNSIFII